MSDANHLANLEALMNIGANLSEIAGITAGGNAMFWCWLPAVAGVKGGWTKRLFLKGVACVFAALAVPGLVAWAVSVNLILGLAVSIVSTCAMIPFAINTFITPAVLAKQLAHPQLGAIRVINAIFFIPFVFPITLAWASFGGKKALGAVDVLGCNDHFDAKDADSDLLK